MAVHSGEAGKTELLVCGSPDGHAQQTLNSRSENWSGLAQTSVHLPQQQDGWWEWSFGLVFV